VECLGYQIQQDNQSAYSRSNGGMYPTMSDIAFKPRPSGLIIKERLGQPKNNWNGPIFAAALCIIAGMFFYTFTKTVETEDAPDVVSQAPVVNVWIPTVAPSPTATAAPTETPLPTKEPSLWEQWGVCGQPGETDPGAVCVLPTNTPIMTQGTPLPNVTINTCDIAVPGSMCIIPTPTNGAFTIWE
jgi:hypothetical protein